MRSSSDLPAPVVPATTACGPAAHRSSTTGPPAPTPSTQVRADLLRDHPVAVTGSRSRHRTWAGMPVDSSRHRQRGEVPGDPVGDVGVDQVEVQVLVRRRGSVQPGPPVAAPGDVEHRRVVVPGRPTGPDHDDPGPGQRPEPRRPGDPGRDPVDHEELRPAHRGGPGPRRWSGPRAGATASSASPAALRVRRAR